ncbi:MAG: SRPBCC domain-containing protein [Actinomycetota bacterium]
MTDDDRTLELEVAVPGTPEEVWEAIATGPGITSWYVPHTFAQEAGARAVCSFGPGPEMTVEGRVAAYEPPKRIVFDGGDEPGLAFEWLVEAADGGGCVVRLVNSGFGSGEEWDQQYDGMSQGWRMFLTNLRLHLEHFRGQAAADAIPSAYWPGDRTAAWRRLAADLGVDPAPAVGDRYEVSTPDAPALAGTVMETNPWRISLLLDEPAPGTALIAAEGMGDVIGVSVWLYLYGPDRVAVAERQQDAWGQWLAARA